MQRSGCRQYESPGFGQAHAPAEHTVPGFNEQSPAWRHSTQLPLGTSQMGVGVMQPVFDMHPLGLPLVLELDDDVVAIPPVPPSPELLDALLLDELAPPVTSVGQLITSVHPPLSSMNAAEMPTSPPIQTFPNLRISRPPSAPAPHVR